VPQAMRCEATVRCRNAVTLARRRCGCVRLLEAAGRRDLGPGTGAGGDRAGSAAHEFPDEGAWQADVGGRGGVGDQLCRGALHGRFGGPDAWLKALPDHLHRPNLPTSDGCIACPHVTSRRRSSTRRSCTPPRTSALRPSPGCSITALIRMPVPTKAAAHCTSPPPSGRSGAFGCWSPPAPISTGPTTSTGITRSDGPDTCWNGSDPATGVAAVREFLESRGSRPAVWGA
jgi:hypothetical protein